MNEPSFIADVRSNKEWAHQQSSAFARLGEHLEKVQSDYQSRTGIYANLPKERSVEVIRAIESADAEPGRALLNETRAARTG